jgi:hypothetical protein
LDTIVVHSPPSSSSCLLSGGRRPRELAGRSPPPRPIATWKLGVDGLFIVGDDTLAFGELPLVYNDPGRARRDGERPPGGNGEDERVGTPEPVYFFWVSVKEKIACERDD